MHVCHLNLNSLHIHIHINKPVGPSADFHSPGHQEVPPANCAGCRLPRPVTHHPQIRRQRKKSVSSAPSQPSCCAQPSPLWSVSTSVHIFVGVVVHVCIHGVWSTLGSLVNWRAVGVRAIRWPLTHKFYPVISLPPSLPPSPLPPPSLSFSLSLSLPPCLSLSLSLLMLQCNCSLCLCVIPAGHINWLL